MRSRCWPICTRLSCIGVALAGAVIAGGCVSPTGRIDAPAPTLELLQAGTLELPGNCATARGAMYRTSFVVQPDGRIADARSESGTGCVQDALRKWVATFEYRPVSEPRATVLDWMAVEASRGG